MLTYKSILYQDRREYSYIDLEKAALDMGGNYGPNSGGFDQLGFGTLMHYRE